jgi:hypothetical protein
VTSLEALRLGLDDIEGGPTGLEGTA